MKSCQILVEARLPTRLKHHATNNDHTKDARKQVSHENVENTDTFGVDRHLKPGHSPTDAEKSRNHDNAERAEQRSPIATHIVKSSSDASPN